MDGVVQAEHVEIRPIPNLASGHPLLGYFAGGGGPMNRAMLCIWLATGPSR
jgi:hypothetical protein